MKSSEAKQLSTEELEQLRSLMQRWILLEFPYDDGSSEQSDAHTTYYGIQESIERGRAGYDECEAGDIEEEEQSQLD